MSHRVTPCSDFSGEVERVPENGDCGEFQAVLAGVCTEKNTAPNRLALACDLVAG